MIRLSRPATTTRAARRLGAIAAAAAVVLASSGPCLCRAFVVRSPTSLAGAAADRQGRAVANDASSKFSASSEGGVLHQRRRRRQGRAVGTVSAAAAGAALYAGGDGYDETCDVLVLGSGPAARAIASLLSSPKYPGGGGGGGEEDGLDVILSDANFDRPWPPNYGVWRDEWDAVLSLYESFGRTLDGGKEGECLDRQWPKTDCYFGGSFDIPVEERFRVDRPYCRVDKDALLEALTPEADGEGGYRVLRMNHMSRATGVNLYSPPGSLVHDEFGSTVSLRSKDGTETKTVRSRLVVDCTGHETKLVLKDERTKSIPPGFQIAYGCLVTVDETDSPNLSQIGPYDKEAMTLFDYRTDHFGPGSEALRNAERAPTFMYAMPLEGNRIFFEETSLVARPAVSFQECKDRCFARLEHLGIKVVDVEEEEFCYIPMGGPLPAKDQRVVGFGGASAMVHPSTGYHLCRAMMGAGDVARAVRSELAKDDADVDRAAAAAYHATWSPSNVRQRNFAVFGGEFLMKQNVEGLRGFFDGFFRLPLEMWGGFLAGWPGLPNNEYHETWNARMWFGLKFITQLPLQVAADMAASIAAYTISEGVPLPQSVTPLLGEPESYERPEGMYRRTAGDVAAKAEARRMIRESGLEEHVPVAFDKMSEAKREKVGEEEEAEVVVKKFQ